MSLDVIGKGYFLSCIVSRACKFSCFHASDSLDVTPGKDISNKSLMRLGLLDAISYCPVA